MPSLTYTELAEALGITPASANKLARRRRWPRHAGNDGKTRVTVPDEALVREDSPPDRRGDVPPSSPPDNPVHALLAQVARLEGELTGVREALVEARSRAEAAEARIERLDAAHADELAIERDKAERARAELASIADRLALLAEDQRRPWWRRLVG